MAGASDAALKRLVDSRDAEIVERFEGVKEAWEAIQFTGYGEAVRVTARRFFGLETLDGKVLAAAQERLPAKWPGGERLRILKEDGGLDHIQVDDACWSCLPDRSGPDFFFYDLNWGNFCKGDLRAAKDGSDRPCELLFKETGVEVKDLETLRAAMARLFEKFGPYAIAVKAGHAYQRTLIWRERADAEAAAALQEVLCDPKGAGVEARHCLG
ncbi:MAG: hypothetical protein AAB502_06465, partial [Chloroflexota bacterium]